MIGIRLERRPDSEVKLTWNDIRDMLTAAALLALGGWVLFHLVLLWSVGWVVIAEPSKPWLAVEMLLVAGVIVLGLDKLRSLLK